MAGTGSSPSGRSDEASSGHPAYSLLSDIRATSLQGAKTPSPTVPRCALGYNYLDWGGWFSLEYCHNALSSVRRSVRAAAAISRQNAKYAR